ncbi:MAG TPA: SPW repeat protein [Longimicrobiaceae bacterium]|nr:SPW repeat protein [Longimicrobiaceae bacterium]
MRFFTTRIHGVLDYLVGLLLIAVPLTQHWAGAAGTVPMALGAATLVYSICTDYELGLVRKLPMPVHLWLDGLSGLLLAASPWIFGFDQTMWKPHVAVGAFEVLAAVLTNTIPSYERRRT